jgi:hypothetical protein
MKQVLIFAFLCVSLFESVCAQGFTDSNLPIVIIITDLGAEIPDDPRINASMKIIYRGPGERNYVTDQNNPVYLNYNGKIEIETRGSSTQVPDKKQYGFSTLKVASDSTDNVSLLGMPREHDWILNAMAFDPALIREYLCYNLSRRIGQYASRTAYCEVVINNVYRGLYVLQEKIKVDDNRVDIIRIGTTDNYLPFVTGGYITKADKNTGGDPVAFWMNSPSGASVGYIHHVPGPEEVTALQNEYIRKQFQELAITALNNNTSSANGFPSVIDIPSFIDYILINELASNVDAYMYSTFFHKDRNGKLRAGPIWDLDLTYGNDLYFWGYDRSKTNVWQFSNGDNEGSRFWLDLFNSPNFRCYLSKRWFELILPGQPLNLSSIEAFIDQTVDTISEAVSRDNDLWGTVGNHQQRIAAIKTFLNARVDWMSTNLGSYSQCINVPVPPLVITKIMYHPATSAEFPDDDNLEFIEITNNGDQAVNLTGIYFSGTGIVFQFPVNSTLGPHQPAVLASSPSDFLAKYGCEPNYSFTRHLSNQGESLILIDCFGNIIDNVLYQDTIPWPDADGNGNYLKLTNPDLDNSLAENWTVSNETIVSDQNIPADIIIQVYPNPVRDILSIQAGSEIRLIRLLDIQGRLLMSVPVNGEHYELDMSHLVRGSYIIRIITAEKAYTGKIVKD